MSDFTHRDQRKIWNDEHAAPTVLFQMDSDEPSSGVVLFYDLLQTISGSKQGAEMGCGKGRNVIWLAARPDIEKMYGMDFSSVAIKEARERAAKSGASKAEFIEQDITQRWPFGGDSLDFVIDCFASTDIEDPALRQRATDEATRVLKRGGVLLVYTLSTDDEFHKEMIQKYPASEHNAFHHPENNKFEKTFDAEELATTHSRFELVESRRVEKKAIFHGKEYDCKHFWNVYRKP